MKRRFVIYRRVSTSKQLFGYSLEAQMAAVETYLNSLAGGFEIVAIVDEQESGANDDRKKLSEAIQLAQRQPDTTILIAKLDRIGRSLPLLYMLIAARVSFVDASNPTMDNFTAKIMMLVAERERELISQRVKSSLAIARLKGVKLGSKTPLKGLQAAWQATREKKHAFTVDALKAIREVQSTGVTSLYQTCRFLNLRGVKTSRNKQWTITALSRVLRSEEAAAAMA